MDHSAGGQRLIMNKKKQARQIDFLSIGMVPEKGAFSNITTSCLRSKEKIESPVPARTVMKPKSNVKSPTKTTIRTDEEEALIQRLSTSIPLSKLKKKQQEEKEKAEKEEMMGSGQASSSSSVTVRMILILKYKYKLCSYFPIISLLLLKIDNQSNK